MSRNKYSKEFKLQLLKEHNEKSISYWKLGKIYGIEASIIRRWGYAYSTFGEQGLDKHNSDLCNYSSEFKQMVVAEYLEGNITIQDLAYKHKILAPSTVRKWIKQYNNHEELTDSRKAGTYLMVKKIKARKRKEVKPMEKTMKIEGMMCPHCERHVTQALSALPGITEVKADHKAATVIICSEGPVDEAILAATIKEAGYDYKGRC